MLTYPRWMLPGDPEWLRLLSVLHPEQQQGPLPAPEKEQALAQGLFWTMAANAPECFAARVSA